MNEYSIIDGLILSNKINAGNIKTDSRTVNPGDIFIAVKGVDTDGHNFIPDVLLREPFLIICECLPGQSREKYPGNILLRVENSTEVMGYIARKVYRDPASLLETYGVTGTNGKTTTVFLLDHILENAGKRCGFISTVYTKIDSSVKKRSEMTTPGVLNLYELLSLMVKNIRDVGIIEISSHALSQKRVWGLRLDTAIFTNITPEHMDYHKNMDSYFSDKARILDLLAPGGRAVLNVDDPLVANLVSADHSYECITFGIDNSADIMADDIVSSIYGTKFALRTRNGVSVKVETGLIGKHNVYNILAAVSALIDRDLSLDKIVSAIKTSKAPPGRLEPVLLNGPFSVFVDYAHTPDALENVLGCLRGITENELICVFGCGGDRDKSKRKAMGKIASDICDKVIVTSDNPRTEDPIDIISQIEAGISPKSSYSVIEEREAAINTALGLAHPGDVVIIAGKGHEDYQILKNKKIKFDDKEIVRKALKG